MYGKEAGLEQSLIYVPNVQLFGLRSGASRYDRRAG